MPAAKKHPSVRARANRASTAATLPSAGRPGAIVRLPASSECGRGEWSPLTVAWWSDIWRSPMANEYHASDRHQIVVLAMLMDDFFTAESRTMRTTISAEIRQHRTAFGMTPYDRRRLEWTIEQAEGAKESGAQRRQRLAEGAKQPTPKLDPRNILHAV